MRGFSDKKKLIALNGNQDVMALKPIVGSSKRALKHLEIFGKTAKLMHVHLYRREGDFVNHKSLEGYFIWKLYWFFVEGISSDG